MPTFSVQGTATVRVIARHWGLSSDTSRRILKAAEIEPVSTGPQRYRWRDIWSLEGAGYVPVADEAEYRRPLLTLAEVRPYFPHLKPRSITDRASKGTLPGILLGTDWRFRECDIKSAAVRG